mmetsp:Transcript_2721/g.4055  ORF Transcript_2721/g.4055 Transcript_2721/m.4055 type:complete len:179 (-) Transcript_2721:20-556(-)
MTPPRRLSAAQTGTTGTSESPQFSVKKQTSPAKKKRRTGFKAALVNPSAALGVIDFFSDLPEDAIPVVFSYITFPELCRIKTVCKWWMQQINASIVLRLGSKAFLTNEEFIKAIKEHFDYMGAPKTEKAARDVSFDKLVAIYGFPVENWDLSQVAQEENLPSLFEELERRRVEFDSYH